VRTVARTESGGFLLMGPPASQPDPEPISNDALTFFEDALHRLDRLPDTEANRLRRIDAVLKQSEVKYPLGQCCPRRRRNSDYPPY
jgi:hypothetical protein